MHKHLLSINTTNTGKYVIITANFIQLLLITNTENEIGVSVKKKILKLAYLPTRLFANELRMIQIIIVIRKR